MITQDMEVKIEARAIADRKIDDKHGFGNRSRGVNELRDAEYKRLLREHATLGDASEVGKAVKKLQSR